jgi:MFS family permease
MARSKVPAYREITTSSGRTYRVGEDPKQILGRSRNSMIWLPWIAMMAAGVFEYAFGSAAKTLQASYEWTNVDAFTLTGVWGFFQAGIALPAGRLREKYRFSPKAAMLIGAALSLIAFLSIANSGNIVFDVVGYGVCGGIGAGLVYATCINIVGKWFPEGKGSRVGFVNGGFAYGSIPFIFLFGYHFSVGNHRTVLTLVGVYLALLIAGTGLFFKDPPKNWWPADVDPEHWDRNRRARRNLTRNPPAVRQYTWGEAVRTSQLWLMWAALVATSGVSFFGINYEVQFARASGFALYVAVISAALLAFVNGTGRSLVGWISDRLGRRETLLTVCIVLAMAQFGVVWAGLDHDQTLFFIFAVISGFGGGAFYPMFAVLTPDYFGENYNASNYGTIYSGKLIGAVCAGPLGAAFIDHEGYLGTYLLAGGLAMIAGILLVFLPAPDGGPGAMLAGFTSESARESRAATEAVPHPAPSPFGGVSASSADRSNGWTPPTPAPYRRNY